MNAPVNLTETLKTVSAQWKFELLKEELDRILADSAVSVGFLGDFSSGKSTLINELVGIDDLLPTRVEPCNAVATTIISVEGVETPRFYNVKADGTLADLDCATFQDMVRGVVTGRPTAHVAPKPSLPAGFIILDTAGLGSLVLEHEKTTVGELPFLDAAVLCVDAAKGGLTSTITAFLQSPGVRHLHKYFIVAVTHADLHLNSGIEKILSKVAADLAQEINLDRVEAERRVFAVSAGTEAKRRDISALHKALEGVVISSRATLAEGRQLRATVRLLPHALRLLEQHRSVIEEDDGRLSSRKMELEASLTRVREEREAHIREMDTLSNSIRKDVFTTCELHRVALVNANNATALEEASLNFFDSLNSAVQRHVNSFDSAFRVTATQGAHIIQTLNRINKGADFGKLVATAALTAWICGGASVAANAAEAAEGAAVHALGRQASAEVAMKSVTQGPLASVGLGILRTVNDINPVNFVGDLICEEVKAHRLATPLNDIAEAVSSDAVRVLEKHYSREYFDPISRELASLIKGLEEAEKERRKDLNHRQTQLALLAADTEALRMLERTLNV